MVKWCFDMNELIEIVQDVAKFIGQFGNGIDETTILMFMVLFDSILALSWRIIKKHHMISSTALSGILRNILVSCLPVVLDTVRQEYHHTFYIYRFMNFVFTIIIGFGILQSIIANLELNGIRPPKFLVKFYGEQTIELEKEHKEGK